VIFYKLLQLLDKILHFLKLRILYTVLSVLNCIIAYVSESLQVTYLDGNFEGRSKRMKWFCQSGMFIISHRTECLECNEYCYLGFCVMTPCCLVSQCR
jgi:hypothetical protein